MISWAIETLIASTLLMLVVLAIRAPVARYLGPHIAYGLWLLPALRMLLPPLPETVAAVPLHVIPAGLDIQALLTSAAAVRVAGATKVQPAPVDWPLAMLCLWGAGSLAFLAWHILSYRRFVRKALENATQLPRLDRGGVEVCASPAARGPFAAGIFLKTVVLPEDYRRRYERDELRLAIEHEVQHHQRCDMSANFVALIVLALHWWNPIAHFAHRVFRIDQELACDALVLAHATPAERHAYGSALLKSACDRLPVAACALGAGDDLKRRLKMMRVYRWNPTRSRVGAIVAAGLVSGGLLMTASGGIAAETSKKVEQHVRTVLSPLAPPGVHAIRGVPALPFAPKSVPPTAPLATDDLPLAPVPPAPAIAPIAPTAPDAPIAPVARIAGLAPVASMMTVSWSRGGDDFGDSAQISRDVAEAIRDAQADSRAEARDARAEARAAQAEARTAVRTAIRSLPRVDCGDANAVRVRDDDKGYPIVHCVGWGEKDKAQLRRTMIRSLERARASIAAMDAHQMPIEARDNALESLDRQLESVRDNQ